MRAFSMLLLSTAASVSSLLAATAGPASAGPVPVITYVPDSLAESTIASGPWPLHQDGGKNPHDASGIVPSIPTPYNPPTTQFGTPYAGYCVEGALQTGQGVNQMQPYYFPFVRKNGKDLEGFFDYRPRNEQEATVAALSHDWGKSWIFMDQALALNPFCPADETDPNNNNVIVDGFSTAYASNSNNAADNGMGHAFVMTVGGVERIYHLNRANNHIDFDQLVVHTLMPEGTHPLAGLPGFGYESPLVPDYPTLEPTAQATSGLIDPDAILGAVPLGGGTTAIVYVSKVLNTAQTPPPGGIKCPSTPAFALTNHDTGHPRGANTDVITIRIATTTDGLTFTDVGAASGLMQPSSTLLNAIRWLGSGSIVPLSDGRYGMFFGAGNCLDNDSDGFHFIGYAETTAEVKQASDLESWTVIYGFDNPILSTDTVTDPASHTSYPANPPLIDVVGADPLTAAQVSPWVPSGGFNTNFFSGRVYDPQAVFTDSTTVTVVFAGYNTPQPSSNLGDYRTIGRFQLQFPANYIKPF